MSDAEREQSPYPAIGETVDGKYRIERMLGEGGMGAVALATHVLRRAPVALKFMSPRFCSHPGAVERFINEAVAASQINSPHVVRIHDVGTRPNGAPYLVMECLEGLDLADLLARDGRPGLPIDRALHFIVQALRGLQSAHQAGIVHRDMKPSNCFVVRRDDEDDFLVLLDFGISKVQQPSGIALTQADAALGTPLYMSPEQARSSKDVDARTDIYSAGVILYELLTGQTPFNSESGELNELLFKLFTTEPQPIQQLRPDVPDPLAATVHRALARDRGARFDNVVEFALGLEPFLGPRSWPVFARMVGRAPQQAPLAGTMGGFPGGHPSMPPPSAMPTSLPGSIRVVPASSPPSPMAATRPLEPGSQHDPRRFARRSPTDSAAPMVDATQAYLAAAMPKPTKRWPWLVAGGGAALAVGVALGLGRPRGVAASDAPDAAAVVAPAAPSSTTAATAPSSVATTTSASALTTSSTKPTARPGGRAGPGEARPPGNPLNIKPIE